jgi:hypothetical protein
MTRQMKTPDGYTINEEYAAPTTLDQRLEWIINSMDEGRYAYQGGYPSQWTTRQGAGSTLLRSITMTRRNSLAMPIRQFHRRIQVGVGGGLLVRWPTGRLALRLAKPPPGHPYLARPQNALLEAPSARRGASLVIAASAMSN